MFGHASFLHQECKEDILPFKKMIDVEFPKFKSSTVAIEHRSHIH